MQVRVLKPYGPWSRGHVFTDMSPNQAAALRDRGLVELLDEQAPAPADRQMRPVASLRTPRRRVASLLDPDAA